MRDKIPLKTLFLAFLLASTLFFAVPSWAQSKEGFQSYLNGIKTRAIKKGYDADLVNRALDSVTYRDRIVQLDQKQPEGVWTFERYSNAVMPASRIERAVKLYKKHKNTITEINGGAVPPEYVIALWGIESDFGRNQGGFSVIEATATLAYEGRRRDFFEGELFAALKILHEGHITLDKMKGSFQGAMGNCQFMPTSYDRLSKDGDGDGKRDIWTNKKDVFASISNYLTKSGWRADERVGYVHYARSDIKALYSGANGAKRIQLDDTGDHKFNKFHNFSVLKKWNNSNKFAAAVSMIADEVKTRASINKADAITQPVIIDQAQPRTTAFGKDVQWVDGEAVFKNQPQQN